MKKLYRYLEIMNFGDGDKRTSTMTSLYELPKEELGHIYSNYKVILKLNENEYEQIHKLLEYKGEYSYNELRAKVALLTERIDNAIEYIKNKPLYTETYDYNEEDNLELKYTDDEIARNDLLVILGDKENESS